MAKASDLLTNGNGNGSNGVKKAGKSNGESNGADGRDPGGRFVKGWKGGPGNTLSGKVAKIRARLFAHYEDGTKVDELVTSLHALAIEGNVAAHKEVFDRLLGKPQDLEMVQAINELQEALAHAKATMANRSNGVSRN